jgi:Cof subfamily protein (haloacid dehalogenase superfamily)
VIRLLVSDIDGTLVRNDKTLSDANRDEILALAADGVAITLISSRPPSGIIKLAETLQLTGPFAAFNGGTMFDIGGAIRFAHRLGEADAAATLRLIDRPGITPWVYADGLWFAATLDNPHLARERLAAAMEPVIRTDFSDLGGRIDKIVGVSDDHALLGRIEERAIAMLGERATVARSQPYYLDITHRLANKGDGVVALARAFGVGMAQTAVLGDMQNDLPMFARGGFSVAMGQAPPAVQASADAVAATNEEDGVADAIVRFIRPRIATTVS